jgi:hypothetical protein
LPPSLLAAAGLRASSLGYADGYNVLVFTSLQTSSDIGGRVAAGTSVAGTFGIGNHLTSDASYWDAVVGGGVPMGRFGPPIGMKICVP